jgi:hypothetical protein
VKPPDPRDEFAGFAGNEHMFFGLADPYGLIRGELERGLREQVPDTAIASIQMGGEPLFLTLARQEGDSAVVTHFAFCLQALVSLSYAGGSKSESWPAALTFLFAHVDQPAARRKLRTYFDLHDETKVGYTAEKLKERLLKLRADL